jgi:hypothetical protein
MEHRQRLLEQLERYEALLLMTTDAQAIAALEQLIQETRAHLAELDSVDSRIGDVARFRRTVLSGQKS